MRLTFLGAAGEVTGSCCFVETADVRFIVDCGMFQGGGTLGRRIVDGAREVRIFGIPVAVRADVYTIGGLSAHADQRGLLEWLGHFTRAPAHTFVVHGEAATAEAFAKVVRSRLKWRSVTVPRQREHIDL